jgi:hypothetical protein
MARFAPNWCGQELVDKMVALKLLELAIGFV